MKKTISILLFGLFSATCFAHGDPKDSTKQIPSYRPIPWEKVPWVQDVRVLGTVTLNSSQDYLPVYDSSAGVWTKIKASVLLASGTGITGSGTTNRVAKFTASGVIGNSSMTDDGSIVTISASGQTAFRTIGGFHSGISATSASGLGNAAVFWENSADANNGYSMRREEDGQFFFARASDYPYGTEVDTVFRYNPATNTFNFIVTNLQQNGSPIGSSYSGVGQTNKLVLWNGTSAFGFESQFTVDTTNNYLQIGGTSPQSRLDVTTNSLGVTQTNTSGLLLANNTAATLGAQQRSPALRFRAGGYKTAATAGSQTVDFIADVLPVQGTTSPTGTWQLKSSINGSTYANRLIITSAGTAVLGDGTGGGFLGDLTTPALGFDGTNTGIYMDNSRVFIKANGSFSGGFTSTQWVTLTGTAAVPSISFQSDGNTGLNGDGADKIGLTTNGVYRLLFGPTGRMYSGTLTDVNLQASDSVYLAGALIDIVGATKVTGTLNLTSDFRPNNQPGNSGEVLVSQGSGTAPIFKTPLPEVQVGTNATTNTVTWNGYSTCVNLFYNAITSGTNVVAIPEPVTANKGLRLVVKFNSIALAQSCTIRTISSAAVIESGGVFISNVNVPDTGDWSCIVYVSDGSFWRRENP